jgi:hypothetical protein
MKDVKLNSQIIKITIFCLLFGVNVVLACSSGHGDIPICKSYEDADIVFIGQVKAILPDTTNNSGRSTIIANFKVEKTYKGQVLDVISLRVPDDECGTKLTVDEKYFVYTAKKVDAQAEIASSSQIRLKTLAAGDIAFANSVASPNHRQSILGRISGLAIEEMKNVRVRISNGDRSIDVVVDDVGDFTFPTKNKGKFKVSVIFPFLVDFYVLGNPVGKLNNFEGKTVFTYDVALEKNKCDFRTFVVSKSRLNSTTTISGVLFDKNGVFASKTKIYLYPKKGKQDFRGFDYEIAETDSNGYFSFNPLSVGEYLLGINLGKTPMLSTPYPQLFFTENNVSYESKYISIKSNQQLSLGSLRLPDKLTLKKVYGKILLEKNQTFSNSGNSLLLENKLNIYLIDPLTNSIYLSFNSEGVNTIDINNDGSFSFLGYEGYEYLVHASGFDLNNKSLTAKPIKVKIVENLLPIELKLLEH